MKALIEVLDKRTNEIAFEYAADIWMNPKSSHIELTDESTNLRPKTFNQSYTMLMDMLQGEIYQNVNFAVRLKGVKHKWEWNDKVARHRD
jgi:hypothetical protein